MTTKDVSSYTSADIDFLEGLEPVRKRFSMYMGGRDNLSFQMVKEVVDNGVDEFQRGFSGGDVWVSIDPDLNQVTVMDNGRGIPEDYHEKAGMPTMELLFTRLHSGGNFENNNGKRTAGSFGVGAKGTNALSDFFSVTSIRPDGNEYYMEFSKGEVKVPLKSQPRTKNYPEITGTGTVITFIPDKSILKDYCYFDLDKIRENLIIRAYVNAGLKVHYRIKGKSEEVFYFENGIQDYLANLVNEPFSKPYYYSFKDDLGDFYEIAFQYVAGSDEKILSYVNAIATGKGKHETGFKSGLTAAMTEFLTEQKLFTKSITKKEIDGSDFRAGLTVIINCKIEEPEYTGQTKDELSNPHVAKVMSSFTKKFFQELSLENLDDFKKIGTRAIKFAEGRIKANKYKAKLASSSGPVSLQLGDKFDPCITKDPEKAELFIVEGNSAGTSVSSALDKEYQALFSLKGKPKNVNGAKDSELISNDEISNLLLILFGTNNLKDISADDVNYHSIFITSDADDDGAHIDSLCLQILFLVPELFERGYVKLALPPKYRYDTTGRGNYIYLRDDAAKIEFEKSKVKEALDTSVSLDALMDIKDKYITAFNSACTTLAISPIFLKNILTPDNPEADLDEFLLKFKGLEIIDNDRIQGIYDGIWHDVSIDKLMTEAELLDTIFILEEKLTVTDKSGKTEPSQMYLIDFFNYLNKKFKFSYDYFKGLGEANPEELKETTFDPATRNEIVAKIEEDRLEEYQARLNNFFSSNKKEVLTRREFVLEKFQVED